eukprot:20304-Heterococcus_DN1.PRE.3
MRSGAPQYPQGSGIMCKKARVTLGVVGRYYCWHVCCCCCGCVYDVSCERCVNHALYNGTVTAAAVVLAATAA